MRMVLALRIDRPAGSDGNARATIVDPRKLTQCLSDRHDPGNRGKNDHFQSLGLSLADWQGLRADLMAHPAMAALKAVHPENTRGTRHVFRCRMPPASDGRAYRLRRVWMRRGPDLHFVTAHPQADAA